MNVEKLKAEDDCPLSLQMSFDNCSQSSDRNNSIAKAKRLCASSSSCSQASPASPSLSSHVMQLSYAEDSSAVKSVDSGDFCIVGFERSLVTNNNETIKG